MIELAIDIETYSSVELLKSGVYKYVEAPDFTILLIAYSYDRGPVQIIDVASIEEPDCFDCDMLECLKSDLANPDVLKTAHNANFERTCLSKFFSSPMPPEQWECTMAKASLLGLPLSLDAVGKALKLSEQKDQAGKALIRYFSLPCKPTKTNGNRTRNLPEHDLDKWNQFKNYCIQDVKAEQAIRNKLSFFDFPAKEKELWNLDQKINDTGVLIDPVLVKNAIGISIENTRRLTDKAVALTGLENPNSVPQLKKWLTDTTEVVVDSLNKETLPQLLNSIDNKVATQVLSIRQEMSKTSVKKYDAMRKSYCRDSRVRGLLQYYGANRTGRWAGRLVQVQNLPQNHISDLELARNVLLDNDGEMIEMLYGSVPDILSQLIRTSFVAKAGHKFIIADFSAIEARVIAWLAGEKWRLDVFNSHGKIYEASASQMFKVPIEQITKGSPLRQKGKVAELALGYQGGPNALVNMGALKMGIEEEELPKLVAMWRNANPAIVKLWEKVEEAAITAISEAPVTLKHNLKFDFDRNRGILFITLPGGRKLSYLKASLKSGKYGGQAIYYQGLNQTTKQWGIIDTYGGKLVENIIQAIARDCLAEAMLRLDKAGFNIVMHVHDEVVIEEPVESSRIGLVNKIMSEAMEWAPGLPLKAEAYESNFYRKD